MNVLLLDSTYEPIRIIGWTRAITLVFSGKAEIVEESEIHVRSVSQSFVLPSVIRQLAKFKRRKGVPFTRINIFARDKWVCQYCAKQHKGSDLTFDHVLPRAQGGKTAWDNIVTACEPCNTRKADRTPEQAGMRLARLPEKPSRGVPSIAIRLKSRDKIPERWLPYIDPLSFAYWNVELETS